MTRATQPQLDGFNAPPPLPPKGGIGAVSQPSDAVRASIATPCDTLATPSLAASERPVLYVAGGYASGFVARAIKAHADKIGARIVGRLDLR